MDTSLHGALALTDWGVIRAQGADAAKFLHGQLTQDFSLMRTDQARLAGYCSAKGRLLASFVGLKRAEDDILLLCKRDILADSLKGLSRFIMRAKVTLSDASDAFSVLGLLGNAALEGASAGPWNVTRQGAASVIGLYPALTTARCLWVAPVGEAWPEVTQLSAQSWAWAEVQSGVAMVSAAIVELFVPQMLNYESVGGVNFKKGCYPGQEVVARSQFRGTLKRRAHLFHCAASLQVGDAVFHSGDAEQPCGTVAIAAPSPLGGWDALVSLTLSSLDNGSVHLGQANGALLALQPLPYPLLADV